MRCERLEKAQDNFEISDDLVATLTDEGDLYDLKMRSVMHMNLLHAYQFVKKPIVVANLFTGVYPAKPCEMGIEELLFYRKMPDTEANRQKMIQQMNDAKEDFKKVKFHITEDMDIFRERLGIQTAEGSQALKNMPQDSERRMLDFLEIEGNRIKWKFSQAWINRVIAGINQRVMARQQNLLENGN